MSVVPIAARLVRCRDCGEFFEPDKAHDCTSRGVRRLRAAATAVLDRCSPDFSMPEWCELNNAMGCPERHPEPVVA